MLGNLVSSLIWYLKIQGGGIGPINPTTKDSRAFLPLKGRTGTKKGYGFQDRGVSPRPKQLL